MHRCKTTRSPQRSRRSRRRSDPRPAPQLPRHSRARGLRTPRTASPSRRRPHRCRRSRRSPAERGPSAENVAHSVVGVDERRRRDRRRRHAVRGHRDASASTCAASATTSSRSARRCSPSERRRAPHRCRACGPGRSSGRASTRASALLVARATLDPSKVALGAAAPGSRPRRHGRARERDERLGRHVRRGRARARRSSRTSRGCAATSRTAARRRRRACRSPPTPVDAAHHRHRAAARHRDDRRPRVDLLLRSRARIHGSGRIDLRVEPIERVDDVTAADGRALLRAAIRATLTLARANQYEEFLGNPDPAGASRTVYAYRTASPPHAAPIAAVGHHRRTWVTTVLVVGVLAAALAAGAAAVG